jgi:BirA family biotin operon repressor/biotin-[acetyl-CoA-carboxylase] ligase
MSPVGNFYGSLLVRPDVPLRAAASLSLVAGLAVTETVDALTRGRLSARVKWPNDVLVDSAKLAGLLLEGSADRHGRANWVIIGLGVNLAMHPEAAPYAVTSLAAEGYPDITPERFLDALGPHLARRMRLWTECGFVALREAWLAAACGGGREASVRVGQTVHRGRFVDVDDEGALRLADEQGRMTRFEAGELFFA